MSASSAQIGVLEQPGALLRFPTSSGALLAIALSAHLAAIVCALSGDSLVAATYFVGGEFALSLALLRLYNGAWVFQDVRMPFVTFMFLYGFSLPAISIWRNMAVNGLAEAAFLYGTAFLGFNLVQWWSKQGWQDVPPEAFGRVRPTFANAALVMLGFVSLVAYAWLKGVRSFLTLDRTQMAFLYTQTWVVAMIMMNGFAMFLFAGWPRLSVPARRLVGVTLCAFVIFHVGLGNRRDFLAMFIFLTGVIASRRKSTISLRTLTLAFVAFIMFMAVGVVRQVRSAPWLLYNPDTLIQLVQQNEFSVPIQTVTYYVTAKKELRWGMTYLAAPSAFIPRALWPEKPTGLSQQFNHEQFGDNVVQGFAYTPVTEAYINFSFVGPFIVMSLVSMVTVALVRNARSNPLLYFLFFSLALEFNRGDSAGLMYFVVVVGMAFAVMKFVSRIEWAPAGVRSAWPARSETAAGAG